MILDTTLLSGFVFAALIVLLIPGPGVTYVVARSITQGKRAGSMSVLGLALGALLHVAAAAVGLSAVLLNSAYAFSIIKFLGACYLIYLGIKTIMQRPSLPESQEYSGMAPIKLLLDGIAISALNPKIALFFLAFLPQFVSPELGSIDQQVFLLGILYVLLALITDGAYVILASTIKNWVGQLQVKSNALNFISGGTFIGLGLTAAFTQKS